MKNTSIDAAKMQADGFQKATLSASDSEGCPYTLAIDGQTGNLLDPVNLPNTFKKADSQQVWVKYTPLRMPNRCEKAQPVEVAEIIKDF